MKLTSQTRSFTCFTPTAWVLKYSFMLALIPVVVTGLALLGWPHRRFGHA
jgi:hypothetical protein